MKLFNVKRVAFIFWAHVTLLLNNFKFLFDGWRIHTTRQVCRYSCTDCSLEAFLDITILEAQYKGKGN